MSTETSGPRPGSGRTPEEVITEELGRLLGPLTARASIRVFSLRVLGVKAEEMKPADVPRVLEGLRPMLMTLLGAEPTEGVIRAITRRFVP